MSQKRVLVFGSSGAAGRIIVDILSRSKIFVIGVDLTENKAVDSNILIQGTDWKEDLELVSQHMKQRLTKLDGLVCVAGGWRGDNFSDSTSNYIESVQCMLKVNFYPSATACYIASNWLLPTGMAIFFGADAARSGTPTMVGYGASKAATFQLCQSLASHFREQPNSQHCVICILPIMLDTPANREAMPNGDYDNWTSLEVVGYKILDWISSPSSDHPSSGSMVQLVTKNGKTSWTPCLMNY